MPLPDATPDKRIYELLKTVDLENLTFADLQAVGQTIYAEQGAEDELRRLVLLNLARLSVIGEWTGLTSAGGGGAETAVWQQVDTNDLNAATQYYQGGIGFSEVSSTTTFSSPQRPHFQLFVAPKSGNIDVIGINVSLAHAGKTMNVAIYETANGLPTNKIGGDASVSMGATGFQSAAPSSTVTLEAGKQYYLAYVVSSGTSNTAQVYNNQYTTAIYPSYSNFQSFSKIRCFNSDNTLPSAFDSTYDIRADSGRIYLWKYTYA